MGKDDLLIRVARIICTTDIPCKKHLEQAQKIIATVSAAEKEPLPLWALASGETA